MQHAAQAQPRGHIKPKPVSYAKRGPLDVIPAIIDGKMVLGRLLPPAPPLAHVWITPALALRLVALEQGPATAQEVKQRLGSVGENYGRTNASLARLKTLGLAAFQRVGQVSTWYTIPIPYSVRDRRKFNISPPQRAQQASHPMNAPLPARRLPVLRSSTLSFLRKLDRSGLLVPAPRSAEVIAMHHDLSLPVVQTYCVTLTAHGFLRREGPARLSVYFRTDKPAPEPRSHRRDPSAEDPCDLPPSYRTVAEMLPLEPDSTDVRGLIARLAQARARCDQSTVNAALHTLDRHGFARCVGQVSSRRADGVLRPGPPRKLWARTDKPLPDPDAHNKEAAAAVKRLLSTQGPMLPREVAQALGRPRDGILACAENDPDILILCEDRADPVKPGDHTPRGKWFVVCLHGQQDDARALLSKRRAEAFGHSSRAKSPPKPPKPDKPAKADTPKRTPCPDKKTQARNAPSPNTSRPKSAPPSSSTKPTASPNSQSSKAPALTPTPPTRPATPTTPPPTPKPISPPTPEPRALLSPDMSEVERIERIRAAFVRALPRLRRDGSVNDLYFNNGQLRHRSRD